MDIQEPPPITPVPPDRRRGLRAVVRGAGGLVWAQYLLTAAVSALTVGVIMRVWQARWNVPFEYSGDALSSAGYFKTTLMTGWFENQPRLGAPYGQHLYDFPFTDDLHPIMIKIFGVFTGDWVWVFNAYYLLGFPLAAMTGFWFLRRCRVSVPVSVALAVLYSIAPYHFQRAQAHYFLGEYWVVPLALGVVLAVALGEPIWQRRTLAPATRVPAALRPAVAVLTGRGAATAVILVLIVLDGAYYGLFTAILLGLAAGATLLARWQWRRFVGAAAAVGVILTTFVLLSIPDWIYASIHGGDPAALVRSIADSERYAAKFTALILPVPGHRIPALAALRLHYDTAYPLTGEDPALGFWAAVGFLLLLALPLIGILRARLPVALPAAPAPAADNDPDTLSIDPDSRKGSSPALTRERGDAILAALSVVTWFAFLCAMIGGFGTLLSFFTSAVRGWNRMVIFLGILSLGGLGLLLDRGIARMCRPAAGGRSRRGPLIATGIALLVFLIGFYDQDTARTAPLYPPTQARFDADHTFYGTLEASLPRDAMVFQTPVIKFPEGPSVVQANNADQLIGFLQTDSLRFSGGGIKGRPQTDWTSTVAAEPPARMTRDLAVVGFAGIVVDRAATRDQGRAIVLGLSPFTGAPALDDGGRWVYLSLATATAAVEKSMSPAQRAVAAAAITHINR